MNRAPLLLGYATLGRGAKAVVHWDVMAASSAIIFGGIGIVMPPVVGSGRISANVLWAPTWWAAFASLDVYLWLRIFEAGPRRFAGALLAGIGATGLLISLALLLIEWKPPVVPLSINGVISLVVTTIGWMVGRRDNRRDHAVPRNDASPSDASVE